MKLPIPLLAAIGALTLVGATPSPGATWRSTPLRTFVAGARLPMLYPTSVVVDSAGRVWVVDGGRNRVLVFAKDGSLTQTVRRVDGVSLSRPMAAAAGPDGRIWIADAGNSRIALIGSTTATESSIRFPAELGSVDLTDLEVARDGARAWAVDNDGHRLLTLDVATGRWTAQGSRGTAWGAFNHPRTVAADASGRTFVTDVLNGRVQRFEVAGKAPRPLVRFGVYPGQIYRPSGIDVEGDQVWIADSVLGVVQIFTADGVLVDALRNAAGEVAHFDAPLGIDVVGDKLFVVESRANRVTELVISGGGGAPMVATPPTKPSKSASEGQECTLCHLDLIAPLDSGQATALVAVPKTTGGQSWAGTEAACISCHDGSVLDSRAHIWSGYAHPREDAVIPASMRVPSSLPLVEGKIACRTCHSPHGLGGSAQKHRGATMLRADARPSELCVACHGDKGGM